MTSRGIQPRICAYIAGPKLNGYAMPSHSTAAAIQRFRFQNGFRGASDMLPASPRTIDAATFRRTRHRDAMLRSNPSDRSASCAWNAMPTDPAVDGLKRGADLLSNPIPAKLLDQPRRTW